MIYGPRRLMDALELADPADAERVLRTWGTRILPGVYRMDDAQIERMMRGVERRGGTGEAAQDRTVGGA